MLKTSLWNSAFTPPTDRTTASEMLKSLLGPVTVNTTSTDRNTLTALSVNYNLAFTVGVALSLAFNFVASSRFTFRTGLSAGRGLRFCGAHAVNYLLSIGLLNLYVRLGVSEYVAPLLVWPVAVPINYLMVRYSLTGGYSESFAFSPSRRPGCCSAPIF